MHSIVTGVIFRKAMRLASLDTADTSVGKIGGWLLLVLQLLRLCLCAAITHDSCERCGVRATCGRPTPARRSEPRLVGRGQGGAHDAGNHENLVRTADGAGVARAGAWAALTARRRSLAALRFS